ncbi:MAG: Cof-type HAD-IIB family hydrolase [Clostridiales bacterium]|jgi:Cof subfamily protein (haloacid dehalogenase superfamily)|nr:Cof-type HAD-IIB family hydrolase [Clostridiales bacterium]
MYRLMLSDIDGTLLNDQSRITPEVKQSVTDAEKRGTRFVLCSGRSFLSIARFEKELGLDTPGHYGIGFNGGMVYEADTHKILWEHKLRRDLAMEIIDALAEKNTNVMVYIREKFLAEKASPETLAYQHRSRIPMTVIQNFHEIQTDVSKVIIRDDYARLIQVQEDLRGLTEGRCNVFISAVNLLEFCPLEAHKGAALEFLARHLGLPPEETIAAGDHINDVSMLRMAGLGAAVANAAPEAKAAADIVTEATNNENAIGEIVRKYIFTK